VRERTGRPGPSRPVVPPRTLCHDPTMDCRRLVALVMALPWACTEPNPAADDDGTSAGEGTSASAGTTSASATSASAASSNAEDPADASASGSATDSGSTATSASDDATTGSD